MTMKEKKAGKQIRKRNRQVINFMIVISAALILVGFDMRGYNGATAAPQPLLSAVGLAAMPALALVLLALSGRWGRRTLPARAARHRRGRRR